MSKMVTRTQKGKTMKTSIKNRIEGRGMVNGPTFLQDSLIL